MTKEKNFNKASRLKTYFTYAGSLPFLACALLLYANFHFIPILGSVEKIISIYGLVIASFVAGSHWGQHLGFCNKWSYYLPISSNINAIFLWFSYLLFPFKYFLIVLIISFLVLLFIDKKMLYEKIITKEYFHIRFAVTLAVISSLIISNIYS